MKRFLFVLGVCLFVIALGAASYAVPKSNVGCGIGTMIFEKQDGLISQLCATTTNGICGNQTFGITSGTLECEKAPGIASNERLNIFVADNMDNLAKDIAKGNGEYLNTLAVLMEVSEGDRTHFYNKLQSNFSNIYTSDKVTNTQVLNNIEAVLSQG
ncbi:MAG: DUF3015 family protein [Spirochaetota bacterium]|nr:DUF3015 family protein [Spirochaetota bacterium]